MMDPPDAADTTGATSGGVSIPSRSEKAWWRSSGKTALGALLFVVALDYLCLAAGQRARDGFPDPGGANSAATSGRAGVVLSTADRSAARQVSVTALGRLEPEGEVVHVSVPAFMKDDRVAAVAVGDGDYLSAGEIICTMDGKVRVEAACREASEQVGAARARLARVRAGPRRGEVEAQRQLVASLVAERDGKHREQESLVCLRESELAFAGGELTRYRRLYLDGAVSVSQLDAKVLAASTAASALAHQRAELDRTQRTLAARIDEARATLARIAEVRPVDVAVAEAELAEARARLDRLNEDLKLCDVRAPRGGRVLRLHVRAGEAVGDKGVADLGQTDRMVAVAEVYQSDIGKIKPGDRATIAGDGFAGSVHGVVRRIGCEVVRQSVSGQDPAAVADKRVVEVKVLIDRHDSAKLAGLTNMQVEVAIRL